MPHGRLKVSVGVLIKLAVKYSKGEGKGAKASFEERSQAAERRPAIWWRSFGQPVAPRATTLSNRREREPGRRPGSERSRGTCAKERRIGDCARRQNETGSFQDFLTSPGESGQVLGLRRTHRTSAVHVESERAQRPSARSRGAFGSPQKRRWVRSSAHGPRR